MNADVLLAMLHPEVYLASKLLSEPVVMAIVLVVLFCGCVYIVDKQL